jgi:hypothetical protein
MQRTEIIRLLNQGNGASATPGTERDRAEQRKSFEPSGPEMTEPMSEVWLSWFAYLSGGVLVIGEQGLSSKSNTMALQFWV